MLISDKYRSMNQRLHETARTYGSSGHRWASDVVALCLSIGTKDVLDYGCGKGTLARAMNLPIKEYDPAIPGKDALPEPADIVVCTDVLEHIEPEHLDAVLAHIASLTRQAALLVIATRKAHKFLPDGRNAHLTVECAQWWMLKLDEHFEVVSTTTRTGQPDEFKAIVKPRGES